MRNKLGLVIFSGAVVGLSGCSSVPNAVNPVSWYRDLTGASKNDDLGNGENQKNLDEGSNEPYPNLANVPAAPDTQLSGVDREKLTDSLIADRQNAQYSADNLRAGEAVNSVPPPAPPSPAKPSTSSATTSAALGAPPSPPPATTAPAASAAPAAGETTNALPPPTPTPNPAPPPTAASAPPPSTPPVSAAPTPTAPVSTSAKAPAATKPPAGSSTTTAQRLPPRGSEAPPAESSLQSPTIPNVPQGEAATPAPPPPHIPAPHPATTPAPAAAASGSPALRPPTQSASAPTNAPATAPPSHSAISYRVADVSFAPGSAYLAGGLRGTIADVVKLHNEQGGRIRIVGFGEATGKDAAVAGLTLALDRAQAVAVALSDSGVAAKDISVEAAPVQARGGADAPRAEIYLEQ